MKEYQRRHGSRAYVSAYAANTTGLNRLQRGPESRY